MLSTRGSHPWLFTDVPPGLKSGTFDTYGQRPGLCYPAPSGLAGYFSLLAAGQRASPDQRILTFRAAVVEGGDGAARLPVIARGSLPLDMPVGERVVGAAAVAGAALAVAPIVGVGVVVRVGGAGGVADVADRRRVAVLDHHDDVRGRIHFGERGRGAGGAHQVDTAGVGGH